MAFAPLTELGYTRILGCFQEREHGHHFEFSAPDLLIGDTPFPGYGVKVWVGDNGNFRWAKVLKTVAYIVVDEEEDGEPIVERWEIKNYRQYRYEVA